MARRIVLIGVRVGAIFAAAIAQTSGAAGALLIDPIVSGKKYADELRYVTSIANQKRPMRTEPSPTQVGLNSAGYCFSQQFIAELERSRLVLPEALPVSCLDTVHAEKSMAFLRNTRSIAGDSKRFWAKRNVYQSSDLEREVLRSIVELEGDTSV